MPVNYIGYESANKKKFGGPMDFTLTEGQRIWQKTVRNFAEKELVPLAQKNDETQTFPMDVVPKMHLMRVTTIVPWSA